MKSTTVALGLLSGLASASYNHPRHFHNPYWRRNETAPDGYPVAGPSTTLTVAVTSLHTITSCAPTVTNCPATASGNSTVPAVVTEVIQLTTTVCPVSDVPSISSSIVGAHSSGLITGTTITASATQPGEAYPTAGSPGSVSASVGTTDSVVTMTIGPESSRSVLTTTLKSTFTQLVTVIASPVPSAGVTDVIGNSGVTSSVTSEEGTTTTTKTSTGTRTVTVAGSESTVPVGSSGSGSGSGSGESESESEGNDNGACIPTTVTVTAPASTVYVTATAPVADTGAKAITSTESAAYPTASSTSDNSSTGSEGEGEGEEDDCPPEEESDVVATATATVVPVPYPTNGTAAGYPTAPIGTSAPLFRRSL
ncbi:hypothetical protein F5X99DRAFT_22239 [Biscogniauxia marginata]|nr:hypothetical protein F5X99DRAFT_22239 [Biscogniauxia marginata]